MVLRKIAIFLVICILVVGVTGCGKKQAEKPRIALIMKSLANEFFKTMAEGAEKHNKEHASEYELIVNGIKDELDVNKQVELVEQMIAQGVDAIVIAPADSKALVSVCKRAADAGIVVVNIDNRFDSSALKEAGLKAPFVGPDNRKGARAVGEVAAKLLKPGDKVAILEGAPNAYNGEQRKLGFQDAMKAARIQIVTSQTAYWETDKANALARSIITAHPDIKALLCANDSMAIGAVKAVEEAGKSGKILVVGYDNISAAQELLKEGKLLATADQHAGQLAVYGIEYALEMLRGKTAPKDKETPVDLITKVEN
ncbi:MAG: sugar ABC transporter substrate-binding protein [Armatimonadetes bacterium]|nr:sugar ABC transporter substrate-binding protein [Armatimonadota bacterium]